MWIRREDAARSTRELVAAAQRGDQEAWRELVRTYIDMVWSIARAHRLNHDDASDVCQNTWLILAEKLPTLRIAEALPGWLATTARREALRILIRKGRETPTDSMDFSAPIDKSPEMQAVIADEHRTLLRAFVELPHRCQQMLRLVANAPELTYTQLAKAIGIAPGSIGQTKGRCLDVLRRKALSTQDNQGDKS